MGWFLFGLILGAVGGFVGAFALAIHAASVFAWLQKQIDKRL
jgi:hypothetical protein